MTRCFSVPALSIVTFVIFGMPFAIASGSMFASPRSPKLTLSLFDLGLEHGIVSWARQMYVRWLLETVDLAFHFQPADV